jgi:hypothetical protein
MTRPVGEGDSITDRAHGRALNASIDCQLQPTGAPSNGLIPERTDNLSDCVDGNVRAAEPAVEDVVVRRLHSRLPDYLAGPGREVAASVQLRRAHLAEGSKELAAKSAEWIPALRDGRGFHSAP